MTFRVPAGLLAFDRITINRPAGGADPDGVVETGYAAVFVGRGTLGTPSAVDQTEAAQRETKIDQVLALARTVDIRVDDQIVCARGTFVVVSVSSRRLYTRAILRKITA